MFIHALSEPTRDNSLYALYYNGVTWVWEDEWRPMGDPSLQAIHSPASIYQNP
jgi:hypothetical protein